MMWKLLTVMVVLVCLAGSGLARPDVSHLLQRKSGDKQKRQNFIGASASVSGNGVILTQISSGDAANVETLLPQLNLLPLEENQPSPFRRLEDRPGYDYQKPDFPLDVHPDSNLVSPMSTQAPEYLPPDGGEETANVDKVVRPSSTTTTTVTPVRSTTTTTTTPAPTTTGGGSTTQQTFDDSEGYGYKKPELPLNINEVIGEPSDINQLATTTDPTTTTTPKASLEYLPPKPRPELVVPKQPSTTTTTTRQPQTEPSTYPSSVSTTTFQVPTETEDYLRPEISVYPDASGTVSAVVTQQTATEPASTAAPEYLPPDDGANGGFQIIVRIDADDNETTSATTTSATTTSPSTSSSSSTTVQFTEPTTTLLPILPDVDSLIQQIAEKEPSFTQQDEQTTTSSFVSSSSTTTTTLAGETGTPLDETSSMISLINQLQEMSQIAGQGDFVPEVRLMADNDDDTTVDDGGVPSTTAAAFASASTGASTTTAASPTEVPTERTAATERPTEAPEPVEARFGSEESSTDFSLFDLLSPTTTTSTTTTTTTTPETPAILAQNDTITTYHPSSTVASIDQPTVVAESSADETEIQARIADPADDGYSYETPENGLTVGPSAVVPSHTLEADGYHYKVPSVPFP